MQLQSAGGPGGAGVPGGEYGLRKEDDPKEEAGKCNCDFQSEQH